MQDRALEAEIAVLGAVIMHPHLLHEIDLQPKHFSRGQFAGAYQALQDMMRDGDAIDPMLLSQKIPDIATIEEILRWMRAGAALKTAVHYARAVKSIWAGRVVQGICREALKTMQNWRDVQQTIDDLQASLAAIVLDSVGGPVPLKNYVNPMLESLEERNTGELIHGIPTGSEELDMMTGGLTPGDLWVVAARPSMGKTVFGLNVSRVNSMEKDLVTAFFSLEMTGEKLARRYLSALTDVKGTAIRDGRITDADWAKIALASSVMANSKIYIDEQAGLSIQDICRRARSMQHKKLGLIVIDYLQLIRGSNTKNRNEELADVSRSLKQLAKDLKIPVLALAQLNRQVESRSDKRPMMSDIRESGQIEQDADVIIGLYRDEVYEKEKSAEPGVAEFIVMKNRDGEIGTVKVKAELAYSRFAALEYAPAPIAQQNWKPKSKEYYDK